MSKRMLGAISVCLLLFTAPVYAEDEDAGEEYVRSGVYFIAAATFAVEGFVSRYGAGINLYRDETWGMFAETAYVLPAGGLRGLDYISVQ
jgi:hypothetical protein